MIRSFVTSARCRYLVRVFWGLYAGTLFLVTHLPVPGTLEDVVSTFDKVIHAAAFFVLGWLTLLAFPGCRPRQRPSLGLLAGLLGYAAVDEYLQGFVNRTPDVRDWISDASGIVLAWCCIWGIRAWRGRSPFLVRDSRQEPGVRDSVPAGSCSPQKGAAERASRGFR